MSKPPKPRSNIRGIFDTDILVWGEGDFEAPKSTASPSVFKKAIFSARGIECGHFTWSLFNNLKEQGHRFGNYMERIPFPDRWPVALLEELHVQKRFRGRGLGHKGVKQFLQDAIERGAVCSILKVGWSTDNWKRDRDRNMHLYASEGFIEVESHSEYEPIVMYRQLKTS